MDNGPLALHETMEMHELLAFKNVCKTKSVTSRGLVSCDRLKGLLDQCAATDSQHIQDLRELLSQGMTTAGRQEVQ